MNPSAGGTSDLIALEFPKAIPSGNTGKNIFKVTENFLLFLKKIVRNLQFPVHTGSESHRESGWFYFILTIKNQKSNAMKKSTKYLSKYTYRILSFLMFVGIIVSCDSVITETADQSESIHSEKITTLNNLFLESDIDITIHDITPASREVIRRVRSFARENVLNNQDRELLSANQIKWNQTEVLLIEDHDMYVSITEMEKSQENGHKVLYTLMNDEVIFYQIINLIPINDIDKTDYSYSLEHFDWEFNLLNSFSSCTSNNETPIAKMISSEQAYTSNSTGGGCTESCVIETLTRGSATFTLFCIATGPYCAAATLIACGSRCVIK